LKFQVLSNLFQAGKQNNGKNTDSENYQSIENGDKYFVDLSDQV